MIVRDDEYLDYTNVPESRGIPPMIYRVLIVGIVCIFIIGGATVMLSGYGHHWPSISTTRVPLTNSANP